MVPIIPDFLCLLLVHSKDFYIIVLSRHRCMLILSVIANEGHGFRSRCHCNQPSRGPDAHHFLSPSECLEASLGSSNRILFDVVLDVTVCLMPRTLSGRSFKDPRFTVLLRIGLHSWLYCNRTAASLPSRQGILSSMDQSSPDHLGLSSLNHQIQPRLSHTSNTD